MKKVKIEVDPFYTKRYPTLFGAEVEIRTKDGNKYISHVDYAKGSPENPMSDEELEAKFRYLTSTIDKSQTNNIISIINDLEHLSNIRELINHLKLNNS